MGYISNLIQTAIEAFPPKSKFSTNDIPDLTGKVAIVTGGNSGIGYHTVKALLEHNAKVYLAARSHDKAMKAIEKLKNETNGKEAIFLQLDLGSLPQISRAAEEFRKKESQLHILINNAGVMTPPVEQTTNDGYDLQFGTNVLGHFSFTVQLLPLLESAAQSHPGDVRIVNVASSAIYAWYENDLNWNTLKDGPARRKMTPMALYSQSKTGNVILSNEFARQFGSKGIVSTSLNPGNLASDLFRYSSGYVQWILNKTLLHPVEQGALTSLWAATSTEGRTFNGKYLIPWARLGKATSICEDEDVGQALWTWCEEQISGVQSF
ncbi:NAD(P)-binding protein [Flagelloscypha sp. PMI_526]|nr:NAD(P)-binding protein [Flagelloscypha sp. PMI_526]